MKSFLQLIATFIFIALVSLGVTAQSCYNGTYSFEDDISPILIAKCQPCHTSNNTSGFRVNTYSNLLMGGNDCGIGIVQGDSSQGSLMDKIKFVIGLDSPECEGQMPPANQNNNLTVDEVNAIATWIDQGAQQTCPIYYVNLYGCTDVNGCNYNSDANLDDGSCMYENDSCDDDNVDTVNDQLNASCVCEGETIVPIAGCTDETACSFNPDATEDDGTCVFIGDACDDGNENTFNDVLDGNCECMGIVVGIEALTNPNSIHSIFPIPVTNQLNINYSINDFDKVDLVIYNSMGKAISQYKLTNQKQISINIKPEIYPNGLYFVSIGNAMQKFIIQN